MQINKMNFIILINIKKKFTQTFNSGNIWNTLDWTDKGAIKSLEAIDILVVLYLKILIFKVFANIRKEKIQVVGKNSREISTQHISLMERL